VRFASLGSGSQGNALVVEAGATRILVDCGFPTEETERRLARLGLAPGDLAGVFVTHEHGDHGDGALPLARRHGLRAWMTHGTARAIDADAAEVAIVDSHAAFAIGDLEVHPFPVPHDAREPVQLVVSDGADRLGILTDVGMPTRHIVAMLSGAAALVLECNYDPGMLAGGPYPQWLKERIGGSLGHLANDAAAALLAAIDRSRLRHVIAAHLSQTNNLPQLAAAALAGALGCAAGDVAVADQDNGFGWRSL
jgi:phosphoribosyl 1,2-cyclic phosphodiesterase